MIRQENYTITSSYGDGFKETTTGSYTDTEDSAKTVGYKEGVLFIDAGGQNPSDCCGEIAGSRAFRSSFPSHSFLMVRKCFSSMSGLFSPAGITQCGGDCGFANGSTQKEL